MIISDSNDLWYRVRPFLEYNVGNILERQFNLSSINYYKLPWTGIGRENRDVKLPKIDNGLRSVTTCQYSNLGQYLEVFQRLGITDIFSPHCEQNMIDGIRVHPIAHQPIRYINSPIHIITRPFLYSFVGMLNNTIRTGLSKMCHPFDSMMVYRDKWDHESYYKMNDGLFELSLKKSKFVLCPGGWGLGTIRFWEALKSGCIPVIFEDIKLPEGPLWESVLVKHFEKLSSLEPHLRSFSTSEIISRQRIGLELANSFLGDNIISPITNEFNLSRLG